LRIEARCRRAGGAMNEETTPPPTTDIERRLELIGRATVAIAAERSLPALLQRIVDTAREVTNARYGALGVARESGGLAEFITSGITPEQRAAIGPPPEGHGLLGVILRGSSAVRIADISAHPLAFGFPPHHPPMTSFLGAPILLRGRNLGNLYLTDKQGAAEFTEEDEQLIQVLAAHAAIAIDSARLYEQTNETLAQRVRELHAANEQLQRLTALVITAQEEERRRIARELHDDTAQALTSVLVRMRLLARQATRDEVRDGLYELLELTTDALDGVRRMALDLRPSTLDDLGLVPAVESYAREFGERWGIAVRTRVQGLSGRLPPDRELIVYRVIQEALTNVAKHAGATTVEISLQGEGEHLIATVRDNGRGFAVAQTLEARERGLGLFGMQERAQLAGGYVDVQSTPGAGTTVSLVAPLHAEDADDSAAAEL
jgi:signal transduction histidine kinase